MSLRTSTLINDALRDKVILGLAAIQPRADIGESERARFLLLKGALVHTVSCAIRTGQPTEDFAAALLFTLSNPLAAGLLSGDEDFRPLGHYCDPAGLTAWVEALA